jgi:hypothetical protein
MATKKIVKKETPKKAPKKTKKQPVKMVEYSMKMVIPTGSYANIQPEIRVRASSPEEAHDYIVPHMNRMWKEYFMVNERVNQQAPTPSVPAKTVNKATVPVNKPVEPPSAPAEAPAAPSSNAAAMKATNAINSCKSLEALEMIKNQVEISVKIEEEEKPALLKMIADKNLELTIDTVGKDEK